MTINGTQVQTSYDIYKASGGKFTAIAPTFKAVADANRNITILFTSVKDNAKVDGIEIIPGLAQQ